MNRLHQMIRMPLPDLTTPAEGRIVMMGRYWVVMDDEVFFFLSYAAPQCNLSAAIVESHMRGSIGETATVQYVAVAYVPHNCNDYV